jgi:hypothetical protein
MEHPLNIIHVFEWINLHSYFCGWNFVTFKIKWSSLREYHLHYYFIHKIYFIHSFFTFSKIQPYLLDEYQWNIICEFSMDKLGWMDYISWTFKMNLKSSMNFFSLSLIKVHPNYIKKNSSMIHYNQAWDLGSIWIQLCWKFCANKIYSMHSMFHCH